tara:strand:+ start:4418 stop:5257 length:840 start_codon:yes stop_codon:yes gene_type:complete
LKNPYKKKLLVTGASGNLGKVFCKKYKNKYKIIKFPYRLEQKKKLFQWISKHKDAEFFLHLAGLSGKKNLFNKKCFLVNQISTINILKSLRILKLKKFKYFLFASTAHVYKFSNKPIKESYKKNPKSFYAISKRKVEEYIFKNKNKINFNIGIARIFNFSNKNQKNGYILPDLKNYLKKKSSQRAINLNNFNKVRDFIHTEDVCKALHILINKSFEGPVNVASGRKVNLILLAKRYLNKINSSSNISFNNTPKQNLYADISILKKLGFTPKRNMDYLVK